MKVTATPEYFVNGRPLPSFGDQQLLELVREELQKAYVARAALPGCDGQVPHGVEHVTQFSGQRIHHRVVVVHQREHEQIVFTGRHRVVSHHRRAAHHRAAMRVATVLERMHGRHPVLHRVGVEQCPHAAVGAIERATRSHGGIETVHVVRRVRHADEPLMRQPRESLRAELSVDVKVIVIV